MTINIQIAGKSNLYIGMPADLQSNGTYTKMYALGEQIDDTQSSMQRFRHNVPADSKGGPQGPPAEIQDLGAIMTIQFNLSKWDPAVLEHLQTSGVNATVGTQLESEVGSLLLKDKSYRIVIIPSKSNPRPALAQLGLTAGDYFAYNFPCAILGSPLNIGQGSKFSAKQLTMEAHAAPSGHPKAGILFDHAVDDVVALVE